MKAVAVSAAVIALVVVSVSAQEAGQAPPSQQNDTLNAAASSASQPRWIDFPVGQSSLLTQLNAVIRAREAAFLAQAGLPPENTVHVTPGMSNELVAREEVCRLMPAPGSRIQTERCFNEPESEKRLNEYQFDEELRFSRQEALRRQMEESMRAASEAARRAAGGR